jgi:phage terminase large subunit
MRDFRNIMGELWDDKKWNASDHIYRFDHDVLIEFFSADQPGKARGPRRDILYCNEVNNIPKPIFDELDMRTRRFVFVDFNPVQEFWCHDLKGRPEVEWIHSTYLDARHVLPETIVKKIEAKRLTDPNWFHVYGLGLVGKIEGLIHPHFDTTAEWPTHGNIEGYGLDFGFNDPAALVRCKISGDYFVCDEVIYQSGLTNLDLSMKMELAGLRKGKDEIIADCAEPKSIEELYRMGWNIKPAIKGPDSVVAGIQKVNQYKQVWTKRSVNAIKEQRNYMWQRDKNGKILDIPSNSGNDHLLDARRYWLSKKRLGPAPGQVLRIAI